MAGSSVELKQHQFHNWSITVEKSHILSSNAEEDFKRSLARDTPLPDMVFPNSRLTLTRNNAESIQFNALDALRCVATEPPNEAVASSKEWKDARKEFIPNLEGLSQPPLYDWTFSTDYRGTLHGFRVEPTTESLNVEKLQRRDPIQFYDELSLFEDELDDHGCATLSLKFRCMNTGFLLLQRRLLLYKRRTRVFRFFLRIDRVLVRLLDTRVHFDVENATLLREWTRREMKWEQMTSEQKRCCFNPDEIWTILPVSEAVVEKLL